MGKKKLLEGYRKVISKIYSPKCHYERINTFIQQYKPTVRGRFSTENLKPFIRSLWSIGILSRARFYYWKLLIKTFFTKIKAFPVAVELAIYGLHFEKVAKRALETKNDI